MQTKMYEIDVYNTRDAFLKFVEERSMKSKCDENQYVLDGRVRERANYFSP